MAKSIFLFKINNNFKSLKNENNLDIILDIFIKSNNSKFYKEQFNLIIDDLDTNMVKNNLINNFVNKSNFIIDNNKLILKNQYMDADEEIFIYNNYLKIIIVGNYSLFLEYLSLYFIELIAINLEEEKIYPLYLVKNNILV